MAGVAIPIFLSTVDLTTSVAPNAQMEIPQFWDFVRSLLEISYYEFVRDEGGV
jgi:hypothetical protein